MLKNSFVSLHQKYRHHFQQNQFLTGSLVFTSISFVVSIFSYFFNLLVARGVNLATYGEYMAALSYITLLSVPLTAFNIIAMRKVGQAPVAERSSYAKAVEKWLLAILYRWMVPLFLGTALIGGVLIWKANLQVLSVGYILAFTLVSMFTLFYTAVLQAYKFFVDAGKFLFVGAVLKLLAGVIAILWFPYLLGLYVAIFVSQLLSLFYGNFLLRKHHTPNQLVTVKFQHLSTYLRRQTILTPILATLGLVALANVDIMLVKIFFPAREAGLYAGLSLLGKIILYIAQPLSVVAYSYFTGSESQHQARTVLMSSVLALVVIGIGSTGVYWLFPHFVIRIIFGTKFLSLSSVLWLTALFGSLNALVTLLSQYWIAKGKWIAAVAIAVPIGQALGIWFFHGSFTEVLLVNILATSGLLVAYLMPFSY